MGEIIPDCPVTRNSSAFPTRAACSPPGTWSVPKHVNCHNPTLWGASQEALRLAGWRGVRHSKQEFGPKSRSPAPIGEDHCQRGGFRSGCTLISCFLDCRPDVDVHADHLPLHSSCPSRCIPQNRISECSPGRNVLRVPQIGEASWLVDESIDFECVSEVSGVSSWVEGDEKTQASYAKCEIGIFLR